MARLFFLAAFLLLQVAFPVMPARAEMTDEPIVRLRSLDKITARTMTFEVKVGSTVKFGPIYIKAQACRKAPPTEKPESAAFLQIWEVTPQDESKWIYSGWMFASSPALSAMDHPIYDVWVLDCLDGKPEEKGAAKQEVNQTVPKEGAIKDGVVTGAAAEPPKEAPPETPASDAGAASSLSDAEMPKVTLPGEELQ